MQSYIAWIITLISVLLGSVVGGIITYFTLYKIEKNKIKNAEQNWVYSLIMEVRVNFIIKKESKKILEDEIKGKESLNHLSKTRLIQSDFNVLKNFKNSGIILPDKTILKDYLEVYLKENDIITLYDRYINDIIGLPIISRYSNITSKNIIDSLLETINKQLELLKEIFNKLIKISKNKEELEKEFIIK